MRYVTFTVLLNDLYNLGAFTLHPQIMNPSTKYNKNDISVDGIIGCGKSTQISKLMNSNYFNEFKIYPEEVDKWVDENWIEYFYN